MNFKILIFFFLIISQHIGISQHFFFKQFSVNEGLDGLNIEAIHQSKDGYLWIASHMGLAKFDGKTFINYEIEEGAPESRILSITDDLNGNIWLGTTNSLVKFDGDKFTKYAPYDSERSNFIRDIRTDSKGNLWLAASGGICKMPLSISDTTTSFIYFPVSDDKRKNITSGIFIDKHDVIWATTGDGIYKIKNDSLSKESNHGGGDIAVDRDGNIWTTAWSSGNAGLKMWNGDSITYFGNLIQSPPTSLQLDNDNNIWVTTFGKGIFRVSKDNDTYKVFHFGESEGYSSTLNWGITKDSEGNIWIGSFGKGVFRFSGDLITFINEKNGLADNVINDVQFDLSGKAWVSTPEGISYYEKNDSFYSKNTEITSITKHNNIPIYSLDTLKKYNSKIIEYYYKHLKPEHHFISNGNIVINPKTGNVIIPTNLNYTAVFINDESFVLPFGSGQSATLDKKNNLWLGSDGAGIYKYDGKSVTTFSYKTERNYNRVFSVFADSKDNIWGGAYSGGIDLIKDDSLYRFDFNGKFQNTLISILGETPDNRIWFTTERGILYAAVLNDDNSFEIVDSLTAKKGLSSNIVLDVEYAKGGVLWIATSKGLNQLDYSAYTNSGAINIIKYNENNGLPTSFISNITIDTKGNLWLSTAKGLCYFNRKKETAHLEPPIVHLTKVELFLGQEEISQYFEPIKNSTIPKNIHLPYSMNHLTFSFIGIHLSNPESVKYRYRLKGFDKGWQPITGDNKVTYSNLPSGDFAFEVSASCENLDWSPPVIVHFTIATPFWKKAWFITLVILSIIGIIVLYIRIKTLKLKKNNEKLETEVKNRTNELNDAYLELSEKNKEIIDSIVYAKRIQTAILPPPKIVKQYLKTSFILYKPKDVVAGDFYWMHQTNEQTLFAVADCTGHGVPGAMVSVICNNALNRSIREYKLTKPGEILDKTREIVIEEFEKSEEDVKDGMDIALVSLAFRSESSVIKNKEAFSENPEQGTQNKKQETVATLQYAGAHNPLWIIRDKEIIETKADKQPIGKFDKQTAYTTHDFELIKGDTIYIFSDGFVDQFGGDKGKKFKTKAFRELLLAIQKNTLEEQKTILNDTFEKWKGNIEQIDDVCIIGVRV